MGQIVEIEREWVIITDTREILPWFRGPVHIPGKSRTIVVHQTVKRATMKTGDYTIEGMEDQVTIERKSCNDLLGTVTRGRRRFERELARLQEFRWSAVFVESDWQDIVTYALAHTSLDPNSIEGSILAWMVRFPKTHWVFRPTRQSAEVTAWKALDRIVQETEKVKNADGDGTSLPN